MAQYVLLWCTFTVIFIVICAAMVYFHCDFYASCKCNALLHLLYTNTRINRRHEDFFVNNVVRWVVLRY